MYCGGAAPFTTKIFSLANMYGVLDFKMITETSLVGYCVLNYFNAAGYLIFAESNWCGLLKEYALNYIVAHGRGLRQPENFAKLNELPCLLWEVCAGLAGCSHCDSWITWHIESVDRLQTRLHHKNQDINRTKELFYISISMGDNKRKLENDWNRMISWS